MSHRASSFPSPHQKESPGKKPMWSPSGFPRGGVGLCSEPLHLHPWELPPRNTTPSFQCIPLLSEHALWNLPPVGTENLSPFLTATTSSWNFFPTSWTTDLLATGGICRHRALPSCHSSVSLSRASRTNSAGLSCFCLHRHQFGFYGFSLSLGFVMDSVCESPCNPMLYDFPEGNYTGTKLLPSLSRHQEELF